MTSSVTSLSSSRAADALEGAVALKQETQHDLSPTEKLEALQWSRAGAAAPGCAVQGGAARGGQGEGLRGRNVRRMRAFLAGAEWDLYEVRYVREHDGVFVRL